MSEEKTKSQKTVDFARFEAIAKAMGCSANELAIQIGYSGPTTASGWHKSGQCPEVAFNAALYAQGQKSAAGEKTVLMIGGPDNLETLLRVADSLGFRAAAL